MTQRMYNRIAEAIAPGAIDKAKKAIHEVSGDMPLSEGIPAADRKSMVKINVTNKVFVEDALAAGKAHADELPRYFSLDELQKRIDGFESMDDLIRAVEDLHRQLLDTQVVLGSEAYAMALTLYHFFERACWDGVPGMEAVCLHLGARFKGQGRKGKDKGDLEEGDKS